MPATADELRQAKCQPSNYKIGRTLVFIDAPINVIPHVCVHVAVRRGRSWTSNAEDLKRRKDFRDEVALVIPRRKRQKLAGLLAVRIEVWRRCSRAADGDNLQKELFDAFTQAGVWLDDRQVKDCHWTIVEQGPRVTPRVRAVVYEWIAA